jgi:hypothetical protein
MENLGPINILRIPLQILGEFPDISAKIHIEGSAFKRDLAAWFHTYEPSIQANIYNQLEWACLHMDYDFKSILKNVKIENKDIVQYFNFLREAIAE